MVQEKLALGLLGSIHRASNGRPASLHHMCVNHPGFQVLMTEQLLDSPDVMSVLQQVGGETVT
jgi:hypothetical protein